MYEAEVKDLSPEEAKKLYDQGVAFIDVREVEEYAQARIPGAGLVPLSEFVARYGEIPKDRPVVLYCRTGNRSWQAAAWLTAQGYANVYNLEGHRPLVPLRAPRGHQPSGSGLHRHPVPGGGPPRGGKASAGSLGGGRARALGVRGRACAGSGEHPPLLPAP